MTSFDPSRRGPLPTFTDAARVALPEVSVEGGRSEFAHDIGIVYGSPEWSVADKVTDRDNMLRAICNHRGIAHDDFEAMAHVALLLQLHLWQTRDAVIYTKDHAVESCAPLWVQPDEWLHEPLASLEFHAPLCEVVPDQRDAAAKLAKLTWWSVSYRNNSKNPHRGGGRGVPMMPVKQPVTPEHWIAWAHEWMTIRLCNSGGSEFGSVCDSGTLAAIETTRDATALRPPPAPRALPPAASASASSRPGIGERLRAFFSGGGTK
jgi:hypothetical protein